MPTHVFHTLLVLLGSMGFIQGAQLEGVASPPSVSPPTQSTAWMTGATLKQALAPELNAISQAYCTQQHIVPCTHALRLNVPDGRRFPVSNISGGASIPAATAPFQPHIFQPSTLKTVFSAGYGVAQVQASKVTTPLHIPVEHVQRYIVWRATSLIIPKSPLLAVLQQESTWLTPREARALYTQPTLPVGATSRGSVKAGEALRNQMIETAPTVQAWKPVMLLASRATTAGTPPLRLRIEGEAMQSGQMGQRVKVRRKGEAQGKVYFGTVTGPGQVSISL
jgi:flagella basal body P-ring formation protein FlgA